MRFFIAWFIPSTETARIPGLFNLPNTSSTCFEIGRMTASILSVTINSILSPECSFRESRTDLGMVIWPLVVIVAIVIEILLTLNLFLLYSKAKLGPGQTFYRVSFSKRKGFPQYAGLFITDFREAISI